MPICLWRVTISTTTDFNNYKCAKQAKVDRDRESERGHKSDKVAELGGVKSPLQRHQPLKAKPRQHSIDLRNNIFFSSFFFFVPIG